MDREERPHGSAARTPSDADLPAVDRTRRTIASFERYEDAQAAVDLLSDRGFPVERLAIVGEGLRTIEQVTGRRGLGNAAGDGAMAGGLAGALLGFLFGLFSIAEPLVSGLLLALWGLLIGAAIGALWGLLMHSLLGGRRDFSSVNAVRAQRYDVIADQEVADDALSLLARRPPA